MSESEAQTRDLGSFQPSYVSIGSGSNPILHDKPLVLGPHYEYDCEAYDEEGPYWEPSNIEEELKAQLGKSVVLDVSKDNIQYATE